MHRFVFYAYIILLKKTFVNAHYYNVFKYSHHFLNIMHKNEYYSQYMHGFAFKQLLNLPKFNLFFTDKLGFSGDALGELFQRKKFPKPLKTSHNILCSLRQFIDTNREALALPLGYRVASESVINTRKTA